jgi:hypothetical protein
MGVLNSNFIPLHQQTWPPHAISLLSVGIVYSSSHVTGKDVRIRKQSVKNLGFIKQLEFVVLDLDMFTSVKSHDLNWKSKLTTISSHIFMGDPVGNQSLEGPLQTLCFLC